MGRQLRTTLPTLSTNLRPKWPDESLLRQRDATYKQNMAYYHDRCYGCKSEAKFNEGDTVRIKTDNEAEWIPLTVKNKTSYPRSYILQTSDGRTLRRNSKHIMLSRAPAYKTRKPDSDHHEELFRQFLDRRVQSFNKQTPDRNNEFKQPDKPTESATTKNMRQPMTNEQPVVTKTRYGRVVRAPCRLNYT